MHLYDRIDMSDQLAEREKRALRRRQLTKLCLFTLFLIYPGISSLILSYWWCKDVNGVSYLIADMTVTCFDHRWVKNLAVSIIALLAYPIGIPCLFALIIYSKRHALQLPAIRQSIGFLYAAYHVESWWLEMVDMLHKLFLTSLLRFFPKTFQLPIGMVAVGIFLIILLVDQPYVRAKDDRLHLCVQIELLLLLLSAYVLQVNYPGGLDRVIDYLLSVVLIGLIVAIVLLFMYHLFLLGKRVWWWRRRTTLAKLMDREREEGSSEAGSGDLGSEGGLTTESEGRMTRGGSQMEGVEMTGGRTNSVGHMEEVTTGQPGEIGGGTEEAERTTPV